MLEKNALVISSQKAAMVYANVAVSIRAMLIIGDLILP